MRFWDGWPARDCVRVIGNRRPARMPSAAERHGGASACGSAQTDTSEPGEPRTGTACAQSLGPASRRCALDSGSRGLGEADGRHVLTAEEDGGAAVVRPTAGTARLTTGSRAPPVFRPGLAASPWSPARTPRSGSGTPSRPTDHAPDRALLRPVTQRRSATADGDQGSTPSRSGDTGRCLRTPSPHRPPRHTTIGSGAGDDRFGCSVGGRNSHSEPLAYPDTTYAAEPHVIKPREYAESSRLGSVAWRKDSLLGPPDCWRTAGTAPPSTC